MSETTFDPASMLALVKQAMTEVLKGGQPPAETDEEAEKRAQVEEDVRRARQREIEENNARIKAKEDWDALPDEEKRKQEEEAAKKNAAYALVSLTLDPNMIDPVRLHEAAVAADPAVLAEVLETMDDVTEDVKAAMIAQATKPIEPTAAEVVGKWLESLSGGRVTLVMLKAALGK